MHSSQEPTLSRRRVLRGAAAGAVGGVALGAAAPASAQSEPDYGDWFDDVDNYDGTVDATGQDSVTVTVGAEGNGANFAFEPAAVRVDPGTTVVWEWTGEGGQHDVAATDGEFQSDLTQDAGHTFEWTFEEESSYRYVCTPHESVGMKGAVVVGDPPEGGAASGGTGLGGSDVAVAAAGGLGLVGALLALFRGQVRKGPGGRSRRSNP